MMTDDDDHSKRLYRNCADEQQKLGINQSITRRLEDVGSLISSSVEEPQHASFDDDNDDDECGRLQKEEWRSEAGKRRKIEASRRAAKANATSLAGLYTWLWLLPHECWMSTLR